MTIRMVGGWVFLLVTAHPGSPGQRAVKRSLLLLLFLSFYRQPTRGTESNNCPTVDTLQKQVHNCQQTHGTIRGLLPPSALQLVFISVTAVSYKSNDNKNKGGEEKPTWPVTRRSRNTSISSLKQNAVSYQLDWIKLGTEARTRRTEQSSSDEGPSQRLKHQR